MHRIIRNCCAAIVLLLAMTAPAFAICEKSFGGAGGNPVVDVISDLCSKSAYPAGATPITASATGTTGATAATLPGVASKTTYICGFSIRSTATAAVTGNATVVGTVTGTLNFTHWTGPVASNVGVVEPNLGPACIPASAVNTAIVVTSAAPGTAGVVSVTAWGYQL